MLRRKQPPLDAKFEDVVVEHHGISAMITYKDPEIWRHSIALGPEHANLSPEEIFALHQEHLAAAAERREADPFVAVEIPAGQEQLRFDERMGAWSPRGHVLRCRINDADDEGVQLAIDEHALTLEDLGKMLRTYAGWGLRLTIVPDDEIEREPAIVVSDSPFVDGAPVGSA